MEKVKGEGLMGTYQVMKRKIAFEADFERRGT